MYSPLSILMWRHCVVRLHKFISTIFEFACVTLLFVLMFVSKKYFITENLHLGPENTAVIIPPSWTLDQLPTNIVFTPETPTTVALMERVAKELHLYWFPGLPEPRQRGYFGLSNQTLVEEYLANNVTTDSQAVIVFKNVENSSEALDYEIRMRGRFMTQSYEAKDGNLGPHENFGNDYEQFLRIQWAIDKSYLELLNDQNITQRVVMQEFPYFEVVKKPWMDGAVLLVQTVCLYSLFLPFVFLMSRLVEERVTGVQELIKMAGVSKLTLLFSHFLNCLPAGLVFTTVAVITLKVGCLPILPNTDEYLLFVMLFLHFVSIITSAMLFSFITNRKQYGVTLATILFVVLDIPGRVITESPAWRWVRVLSCLLLPHTPLFNYWHEVRALEVYDKGVDFCTMWETHSEKSLSAAMSVLLCVLQIAIYAAAVAYLTFVRPGPYGSPQPWDFLFKRRVTPERVTDDCEPVLRDSRYYEPMPSGKTVGIKIMNVSKVYGKDIVLNNVSLDIYKGEITVLLGHNGAGKTTLMNIITGMTAPSTGGVLVNGVSCLGAPLRRDLGLCPQHNLFLPALTVQQHVVFFAMLKGQSYCQAVASSKELLGELGLYNKAGASSGELSGGMKRRLQLACALSGGATVLVLDEPTSGLDVETRRELWDLLLSLRGSRTVVLSTHFMEEADALGDRVAALHHGALVCHATPIFLKSHVGTGYVLTLSTIGSPREPDITNAVTTHVAEAKLRGTGLNTLTYNLPTNASKRFPALFKHLESRRSELAIDNIGVGMSTLEEVFVKLCSNIDTNFADEDCGDLPETTFKLVRPPLLYFRQLNALLKRHALFIWSTKWSFLMFQVLMPVTFIFMAKFLVSTSVFDYEQDVPKSLALSLDIYKDVSPRLVYFDAEDKDSVLQLAKSYKDAEFVPSGDIVTDVIRLSETDFKKYQNLIAGFKINKTTLEVVYTTWYRHAAGVALNLMSQALLKQMHPDSNATITTRNHPVPVDHRAPSRDKALDALLDPLIIDTWFIIVIMIILATVINVATMLVREVECGTRRLHTMSGCSAVLQWGARLVFHTPLYTALLILPALIAINSIDDKGNLTLPIHVLGLILVVGLAAWLSLIYLLSIKLSEGALATLLSVFLVGGIVCSCLDSFNSSSHDPVGGIVTRIFTSISAALLPSHRIASASFKTVKLAYLKAAHTLGMCPPGQNCENVTYFGWKKNQPSHDLLALGIQFGVYMLLVLLAEEGVFQIVGRMYSLVYKPRPPRYHDQNARAEALYVQKALHKPQPQDVMLVKNIHKSYLSLFSAPVHSIRGVSFSVKKGECFGLLGVNGAGKSTTFKTMVAEVGATRGRVWANGHHLRFPKKKYLESLSYCPQFLGVDTFLTGYQNLALLLTMRGLSQEDVQRECRASIAVVGLERLQHMPVSQYSGGCARRISAASALCAAAPLTLLDEPTAGVDVAARRRVWAAIRRALTARRAVLLTSHSMDEMEALCSRLAILSGGEVCALGAPGELRSRHAQGYALRLKLAAPPKDSEMAEKLNALKSDLAKTFGCTLKDEHRTMLLYHIDEPLAYSDLFTRLEALKAVHEPFIEDYTVSQTTLEEVFLSFAQDAHKMDDGGAGDAV